MPLDKNFVGFHSLGPRRPFVCWQWFEDLQGCVEDLHARGWSDTAIVAEVLPRTWFAIGQEIFTLWDLSSLNLVQSILYGPVTRPEVDDVMRRIRSSSSR